MKQIPSPGAASLRQWLVTWRPIEVVEAVLGVLAVVGLDLIIPPAWGLQHLNLYALWIVVLAIAARYGAPAGYVAGILSAVAFDILILFETDPFQPVSPHQQIQPFLLFTAGVLVSEVVRLHKRRVRRAELKYQQAAKAMAEINARYEAALDIKNELEKRIAVQPVSVVTVAEFAKKFHTIQREEMYSAILDLVRTLLETQACALYLTQDDELRLKAGQPEAWPDRPLVLAPIEGVISRVLRERQVVTIRDALAEHGPTALTHEPVVMAGPLTDRDGQVIGVVLIEKIPFSKFTPNTIRLFTLLLDWASSALHNATTVEQEPAQQANEVAPKGLAATEIQAAELAG